VNAPLVTVGGVDRPASVPPRPGLGLATTSGMLPSLIRVGGVVALTMTPR
jgi:hypothetical protein